MDLVHDQYEAELAHRHLRSPSSASAQRAEPRPPLFAYDDQRREHVAGAVLVVVAAREAPQMDRQSRPALVSGMSCLRRGTKFCFRRIAAAIWRLPITAQREKQATPALVEGIILIDPGKLDRDKQKGAGRG
jgi:hypothetical protein